MEKDVVLCKDCMYDGTYLCPMKSDWRSRPDGFCDVGERIAPFRTGVLLGSEDGTVYFLIIGVEEDVYGKGHHRYSCVDTLHELPTFMTNTDLAAYRGHSDVFLLRQNCALSKENKMKYVSVDDLVSFALSDESLWLYPKEPMDLRPFIEHAIKLGGVRAIEEEDDTGTLKKLEKRITTLEAEMRMQKHIQSSFYGKGSKNESKFTLNSEVAVNNIRKKLKGE